MGCLDHDLGNSMDVGRNERWNKITQSGVDRKLGQGLPGFFCDMHVCYIDGINAHMQYGKGFTSFFFARLSMEGKTMVLFWGRWRLEIQDVFLLKFPALLQSLNLDLDFVCYFIFFASTFETIQFQYVF